MIVCVCKRVSDRTILNVIQQGAGTVDAVRRRCGAGGDCGSCRASIEGMVEAQARTGCGLPQAGRTDKRAA